MSSKTKEQKRAREIQTRTGWSYSECLRLALQGMNDEAINALIAMREGPR